MDPDRCDLCDETAILKHDNEPRRRLCRAHVVEMIASNSRDDPLMDCLFCGERGLHPGADVFFHVAECDGFHTRTLPAGTTVTICGPHDV